MANVDVNYKMIGINVSIHRHRLSLTQEVLAEKAGLSKQFVGNIECGKAIPRGVSQILCKLQMPVQNVKS